MNIAYGKGTGCQDEARNEEIHLSSGMANDYVAVRFLYLHSRIRVSAMKTDTTDYSWARCVNWPERRFGPMSDTILPIQLRKDVTVLIQGIPHDLTLAEAEKIARVIEAHHA